MIEVSIRKSIRMFLFRLVFISSRVVPSPWGMRYLEFWYGFVTIWSAWRFGAPNYTTVVNNQRYRFAAVTTFRVSLQEIVLEKKFQTSTWMSGYSKVWWLVDESLESLFLLRSVWATLQIGEEQDDLFLSICYVSGSFTIFDIIYTDVM
jgi:hypothetical protein